MTLYFQMDAGYLPLLQLKGEVHYSYLKTSVVVTHNQERSDIQKPGKAPSPVSRD